MVVLLVHDTWCESSWGPVTVTPPWPCGMQAGQLGCNQMPALQAKDDKCQKEKEDRASGTLDGVEDVPKHNETALAQVLCWVCVYQ